ncbi:HNH endonuclease [Tissierella carlieri]|uniref:HNH endonuclease n=1 Tax=Tissierella carlieri TaxID=689904 RepID=A0ABT1SE35_9FIRM|nr:DUF262 domain-containing protein [Tissierella carlieri]MBU5313481.1 HNH endonuclease [Tissierella carlieri]MCQ4924730.1 HNH endonuclease [Tissierella carlieri]
MKTVTLDSLIPREDFEIISTLGSSGNTRNKATLSIEDLKYNSFFFSALRKPIFQRETNEWNTEKVCSMIESFVNGELVPAIILWRNQGGYIFVIDGAHRLSSLSAWINDDYGDGSISLSYFGNYISPEQKEIAQKTRDVVNKTIGSFKEILEISMNCIMENDSKKKEIAKNLGALALQLQWVEGDANKAEDSFLKINQSATKISDAELELIKNREKAYAIAARAIVRAGKGYQYWSKFSESGQNKILTYCKKIHMIMFGEGKSNADDINSLTIGGLQSSNLTLDVVTQTVKICNNIDRIEDAKKGTEENVEECLRNTLLILQYINSKELFSLGIHPFIYFYSDIGKHKVASYYGFLLFMKELIVKKQINLFVSTRGIFEQVIYQYSFLVQQIVRKNRQSKRAYTPIKDYFLEIMNIIKENPYFSAEEVVMKLRESDNFKYLQIEIVDNEVVSVKSNFSRGKKQQIKLKTFVSTLAKCPICKGYMDSKSISVDHIQRKQDGGSNALANGQVTHLYCNTTYKN